jgi:hypothetical protein
MDYKYTFNSMAAITHPDYATLVDPLFRKRERGFVNLWYKQIIWWFLRLHLFKIINN